MHKCRACDREYKRPEHLQRHYDSHSSNRLHRCNQCSAAFQRSDVLSRHQKTCSGIAKKKLTKKLACDRCVRLKRACNLGNPCETCRRRGVLCLYSSSGDESRGREPDGSPGSARTQSNLISSSRDGHNDSDASFLDFESLENLDNSWTEFLNFDFISGGENSTSRTSLLRFLDNFTKHTGFVDSFECGELSDREAATRDIEHRMGAGHNEPGDLKLHDLQQQAQNIVILIQETIACKKRNSAIELTWTYDVEAACVSFFSPWNLCRFVEIYWAVWHPNVNLVHRHSFDIINARELLLVSMALIGTSRTHREMYVCIHADENRCLRVSSNI